MTARPPLPAPFQWDGDHIAVQAPGGRALFMTKGDGEHDVHGLRRAEGHQVHEQRVRRVAEAADLDAPMGDYDGQATSLTEVACVVRTADCLPVALIADGAVAMVHAGWRGLVAGVLEQGVGAVQALGAASPITAAIGPCIGACCYEVGAEVLAEFGIEAQGPALLDLRSIALARLRAAGVAAIHDTGVCTMCSDPGLLNSFRRDQTTARQESLAWRS